MVPYSGMDICRYERNVGKQRIQSTYTNDKNISLEIITNYEMVVWNSREEIIKPCNNWKGAKTEGWG